MYAYCLVLIQVLGGGALSLSDLPVSAETALCADKMVTGEHLAIFD